jgi:hypothetical protein
MNIHTNDFLESENKGETNKLKAGYKTLYGLCWPNVVHCS